MAVTMATIMAARRDESMVDWSVGLLELMWVAKMVVTSAGMKVELKALPWAEMKVRLWVAVKVKRLAEMKVSLLAAMKDSTLVVYWV